jgi:hypothetical protein
VRRLITIVIDSGVPRAILASGYRPLSMGSAAVIVVGPFIALRPAVARENDPPIAFGRSSHRHPERGGALVLGTMDVDQVVDATFADSLPEPADCGGRRRSVSRPHLHGKNWRALMAHMIVAPAITLVICDRQGLSFVDPASSASEVWDSEHPQRCEEDD